MMNTPNVFVLRLFAAFVMFGIVAASAPTPYNTTTLSDTSTFPVSTAKTPKGLRAGNKDKAASNSNATPLKGQQGLQGKAGTNTNTATQSSTLTARTTLSFAGNHVMNNLTAAERIFLEDSWKEAFNFVHTSSTTGGDNLKVRSVVMQDNMPGPNHNNRHLTINYYSAFLQNYFANWKPFDIYMLIEPTCDLCGSSTDDGYYRNRALTSAVGDGKDDLPTLDVEDVDADGINSIERLLGAGNKGDAVDLHHEFELTLCETLRNGPFPSLANAKACQVSYMG